MFTIPNIFIAGKKAVAYEVNENFEAVKNEINKINSNIARCERCKGAGKTMQKVSTGKPKYSTSGVCGIFQGYETVEAMANCPNCGGSGLKWKGEGG